MAIIYIADSAGRQTHCSEHDARTRWREGQIARDCLYWMHGMDGWRSVVEYFEPAARTSMLESEIAPAFPRGFVKDPKELTRFVIVLLWLSLANSVVAAILSGISLATGQAVLPEAADLSAFDMVSALFGLVQLAVFIVTAVNFLRWVHRAHVNAHGLGATNLTITPGWAVGWFFVPIMNLWKPFQAMKELWQASQNPDAWESETPSSLLTAWWILWLLSNVLAQTSLRLGLSGDQSSMMPEVCALLSDIVDIPLTLVVMRLVRSIHEMQSEWAARPPKTSA